MCDHNAHYRMAWLVCPRMVNNRKFITKGRLQGVPKRCIHKVNIPYYNVYTFFGIPCIYNKWNHDVLFVNTKAGCSEIIMQWCNKRYRTLQTHYAQWIINFELLFRNYPHTNSGRFTWSTSNRRLIFHIFDFNETNIMFLVRFRGYWSLLYPRRLGLLRP
jgi:hypothetical protein